MDVRELRIGNLVMDGRDIEIVNSRMISMLENNQGDFDPIPITDQWLNDLKFTWIKEAKTFVKDIVGMKLMKMCVTFDADRPPIFSIADYYSGKEDITVMSYVPILYVHQIQNLFFALTGKELQITPPVTKPKEQQP